MQSFVSLSVSLLSVCMLVCVFACLCALLRACADIAFGFFPFRHLFCFHVVGFAGDNFVVVSVVSTICFVNGLTQLVLQSLATAASCVCIVTTGIYSTSKVCIYHQTRRDGSEFLNAEILL